MTAKTDLSPAEVLGRVREVMGPAAAIEPLAEGLTSQAFGFWSGGRRYVARVGRSAAGYRKDKFAAERFASIGLPIPRVVWLGEVHAGAFLCISERAAGERLDRLAGVAVAALTPQLVDLVGAIGSADIRKMSGYGVFDAEGRCACASWAEYLGLPAKMFDWRDAGTLVDARQVAAVNAAIARLAPRKCARGLVHGDLGSANILSDGKGVTAVIDWDMALIGDPAYDIANLEFWREPALADLRRALPPSGPSILCYQLRIFLDELYACSLGSRPGDLSWLRDRGDQLLRQAA